jgi:hypothetical protein
MYNATNRNKQIFEFFFYENRANTERNEQNRADLKLIIKLGQNAIVIRVLLVKRVCDSCFWSDPASAAFGARVALVHV